MSKTRILLASLFLCSALIMMVYSLCILAGGKPVAIPQAQETFFDTQKDGSQLTNIIGDQDSESTYVDKDGGVACYIFPGGTDGSGDAILDTRGSKPLRVLSFHFLPAPQGGTSGGTDSPTLSDISEPVWVNVRGVNNLSAGETMSVGTVSFNTSLGNFRFLGNQVGCRDCNNKPPVPIDSNFVTVNRISDTKWEVWTVPGQDIAVRLVSSPRGLVPAGYYHLPFHMTIESLN